MSKKTAAPRFRRYPKETRGNMLIEAGLACLARGGIGAFTVDNICREAQVSRGLIQHHFGSKDALLAALYVTMYDRFTDVFTAAGEGGLSLDDLVESCVAPEVYNAASLKIWLALWGEIANNAELRQVHRARYLDLIERVSETVAAHAARTGRTVDARLVATQFIALSDGLWLEHGIDTDMLSQEAARAALSAFFEDAIGTVDRSSGGS